jgi:hypothetical protein
MRLSGVTGGLGGGGRGGPPPPFFFFFFFSRSGCFTSHSLAGVPSPASHLLSLLLVAQLARSDRTSCPKSSALHPSCAALSCDWGHILPFFASRRPLPSLVEPVPRQTGTKTKSEAIECLGAYRRVIGRASLPHPCQLPKTACANASKSQESKPMCMTPPVQIFLVCRHILPGRRCRSGMKDGTPPVITKAIPAYDTLFFPPSLALFFTVCLFLRDSRRKEPRTARAPVTSNILHT